MRTTEFARRMGVSYETVLKWLKQGLVPGAVLKYNGGNSYWDIPATALQMECPKRIAGRKTPQIYPPIDVLKSKSD